MTKKENTAQLLVEQFGWEGEKSDFGGFDTVVRDFENGIQIKIYFNQKTGKYLTTEIIHDEDEAYSNGDSLEQAEKIVDGLDSLFERENNIKYQVDDYQKSYSGLMKSFNVDDAVVRKNYPIKIVTDEAWYLTPFDDHGFSELRLGYTDEIKKEGSTDNFALNYGESSVMKNGSYTLIFAEDKENNVTLFLLKDWEQIEKLPKSITAVIRWKETPDDTETVKIKLSADIENDDDEYFFYFQNGGEIKNFMDKFGAEEWQILSYSFD